jgi:hypothetical protein
MRLCGLKTRSVFDRYRIVAEREFAEGLERLARENTDKTRTIETISTSAGSGKSL